VESIDPKPLYAHRSGAPSSEGNYDSKQPLAQSVLARFGWRGIHVQLDVFELVDGLAGRPCETIDLLLRRD